MAAANSLLYLVSSLLSLVAHDRPTPNFSPRAPFAEQDPFYASAWRSTEPPFAEQDPHYTFAWRSTEPPSSALNPICQQEKQVGTCKGRILRYFYNQETHRCELFMYGGCGGNENNFGSKAECESNCRSASFAAQDPDYTSSWRATEYPLFHTYAEQDPDYSTTPRSTRYTLAEQDPDELSATKSNKNRAEQWPFSWNQQYPSVPGSNAEQYPRVDPDELNQADQYPTDNLDNSGGCPDRKACSDYCKPKLGVCMFRRICFCAKNSDL